MGFLVKQIYLLNLTFNLWLSNKNICRSLNKAKTNRVFFHFQCQLHFWYCQTKRSIHINVMTSNLEKTINKAALYCFILGVLLFIDKINSVTEGFWWLQRLICWFQAVFFLVSVNNRKKFQYFIKQLCGQFSSLGINLDWLLYECR